jgi:hypothetical protein
MTVEELISLSIEKEKLIDRHLSNIRRCCGPLNSNTCKKCHPNILAIVRLEVEVEALDRRAHVLAADEGRVCRDELCWEVPIEDGWCEEHRGTHEP